MKCRVALVTMSLTVAAFAPVVASAAGQKAKAEMKDAAGQSVGTIEIQTTNAGALFKIKLTGLPPGPHGFHLHETGTCEGDFSSAGGIYNPHGSEHGFLAEGGPMAGDLPNIYASASGEVEAELVSAFIVLDRMAEENIFDEDGTALVIKENADDYESDPDTEGGARIACGVVKAE